MTGASSLKIMAKKAASAGGTVPTTMPWLKAFSPIETRVSQAKNLYNARNEAQADLFDCIEVFYNHRRRQSANNLLSQVD